MTNNAVKEKPRKPVLGRGLSSLLSQAEATYASTADALQVRRVKLDQLQPGRFQPRRRFDAEAIASLADSIRTKGVLQPLLVRRAEGNKYEIIAGERRWRAAQQADQTDVPVLVQDLTDGEALEIGLIENLQRQDLNALEEAEAYKRLMDEFGHGQQELADAIGKSRSHIANTLRLLTLPEAVKTMLVTDRLTAGHARALLGAADPAKLAEQVAARGLSVRDTERLVSATPKELPAGDKKKPAKRHVDIASIESDLTQRLGNKVQIAMMGESGKITLSFKDFEQFDNLLARLTRSV